MCIRRNIGVLGEGAWGSALALNLLANGHDVSIWGPFPDYLAEMSRTHENARFLPGIKLPGDLNIDPEMKRFADADIVVLASPAQYMRGTLAKFAEHHRRHQLLVNVAKGIEVDSCKRVSELCAEIIGECRYSVLSGPSHAEELARNCPTAVVAAADRESDAEEVQEVFINDTFRVYTSTDVTGLELGGALKNVFAIAAGIIDGMQLGDNPKAALMTRGIAEMARLGQALGGQAETFSGLSGIGDLIVTCCSGHSRNRHVGEELGRGKTLPEILNAMGMVVAEGVKTARSAAALSLRAGVDTPIIDEINAVLYEDKSPGEALLDLMTRRARPELDQ